VTASLSIAVLEGGATGEREVSLTTGAAVRAALESGGHRLTRVEVLDDGLTWRVAEGELSATQALVGPLRDVDVFFLALHGGAGEGGPLQGLFESVGARFTGSGTAASVLCLDKLAALLVLESEGLRTAERLLLQRTSTAGIDAALALGNTAGGLVVKPRRGGSSVATTVLPADRLDRARLEDALDACFEVPDDALVEACVTGIEVTCGVLEDEAGQPRTLPVVEIQTKDGRFFDYEEKYSESGAVELCPPVNLAADELRAVESAALLAHERAGCAGYSRSDFIVPRTGDRTPVFLEVNTLPGMTPRSLLPLSAGKAGHDFAALCERIVRAALGAS
jgi:D-alanine-D-alanine ligase